MNKKKKAFTLTELLVVVVVIGVLSAVVLPKFSKVIETRRTTEAEELMGAIRTEQEKRCALDKEYATDFNGLSDIVKSDTTKNYTLTLASTGVNASRKDKYNYTLSIPSYADGRICCSGDDCDKLNKNYPKCDNFTPEASPLACAGEVEESPECTNGEVRGSETCNGCGTRTTQKCVNGKWTNSPGACSKTEADCCPEGTVWDGSACAAKKTCEGAPEKLEQVEPCGAEWDQGLQKRTFNLDTCSWGEWDTSGCYCPYSQEPKEEDYAATCNTCGKTFFVAWCDEEKKQWTMETDPSWCSVQDTNDCYEYTWQSAPAKSCVRNMGLYITGAGAEHWTSNDGICISCFTDYGSGVEKGCYTSALPADYHGLKNGCQKVMEQAEYYYDVKAVSLGSANPYSNMWDRTCRRDQEGYIGYGYQEWQYGMTERDAYGCHAFVCTRGALKK